MSDKEIFEVDCEACSGKGLESSEKLCAVCQGHGKVEGEKPEEEKSSEEGEGAKKSKSKTK